MMTDILQNKLGKLFPPAARTSGLVFILLGIYLIANYFIENTSSIYGGLSTLIIGLFMFTSTNGVLINVHTKTYKSYTSLFGYKYGKWQTTKAFPYITLFSHQATTYAHSRSNRTAQTSSNLFYDIYLIDKSKRNKVHIKRMKDKTKATNYLKELSDLLNVKIISK